MDRKAWWYINGNWVHPHDAAIPITDVGVLRGYSVFEAFRTYDRRPFHLDEHLARLYRSAVMIELDISYTREFLIDILHELIERNTYKHAAIRILVTGGETEDGILPAGTSGLAILITELGERDMARFARGIKLITTQLQRVSPQAKTSNYVSAIRALKEAAQHDASDALFVDEQGHMLEGTRSNFFIFRGDVLVTPRSGILLGVTRNVILELARNRFQIEERPILLTELPEVDEAFITSSSKEITPVIQIDNMQIGVGRPGPRTYEMEQCFIEMIDRHNF